MLKIFNECLTTINKCIKGLLEDGLLSVNQDFGETLKPWQRDALDGVIDGGSVVNITGCCIPEVNVHGLPTDSVIVGVQYKKDNVVLWASALIVCDAASHWTNVSVLTAAEAQAGLDENKQVIGIKYESIGEAGLRAAIALPKAA